MSEFEQFATEVVSLVQAVQTKCDERISQMEASIVERIEAAVRLHVPVFLGAYESGKAYAPPMAVMHDGSTFLCLQATTTRPGDGNVCWQMVARKGKDAGR